MAVRPVAVVAVAAFFMKEPPRGQFEKDHVLHEVIQEQNPAPISMEAAFARLKRVATIRVVLVAFCAIGFDLFSQGTLSSLYLDKHLHVTNVLDRGILLSLTQVAALPRAGSNRVAERQTSSRTSWATSSDWAGLRRTRRISP